MSEPGTDPSAETDWQRRRRLAAVFGDVLPDTTSDERDPATPNGDPNGGQSGGQSEDAGEAWLKAQVPPHHG